MAWCRQFPQALRHSSSSAVSNKRKCKWADENEAERRRLRMGASKPWTSRPGISLTGVPDQDRARDLVDIVWERACQEAGKPSTDFSVANGLFIDPGQSLARCGSSKGVLRTQLTGSIKYSYELDRSLLAADFLGILGFAHTDLDFTTPERAKSLVGEAVAAQQMGTAIYALLCVLQAPDIWA